MNIERTQRGFALAKFTDEYLQQCSIQDSSRADEDAIWLGVDFDMEGKAGARMHLSVEQVEALLPLLNRFVENGSIA